MAITADASKKQHAIYAGQLRDDMRFDEKVWALTTRVPRGRVVTYAQIARKLGTRAYRAVGGALNRNPYAPDVPCHRVVGAGGRLGGFASGADRKAALLEAEGVEVRHGRIDLTRFGAEL